MFVGRTLRGSQAAQALVAIVRRPIGAVDQHLGPPPFTRRLFREARFLEEKKKRLKLLRKPLRKLFALALWHCPEAATSPWTRRRFTSEVQRAAAISC